MMLLIIAFVSHLLKDHRRSGVVYNDHINAADQLVQKSHLNSSIGKYELPSHNDCLDKRRLHRHGGSNFPLHLISIPSVQS